MARLDWDRLRRIRPLDGADARVDPDGGALWERPGDGRGFTSGRPLRAGVIRRRRDPHVKTDAEPARSTRS